MCNCTERRCDVISCACPCHKIGQRMQAVIEQLLPTDEISIREFAIKNGISHAKHDDEVLSKELEDPILLIHAFKHSGKWYSHLERMLTVEERHLLCEPWKYHKEYDLRSWIMAHPDLYSPVRCTVEDGKKVWNRHFTYIVQVFIPVTYSGFCIFSINPAMDLMRG